MLFNSFVFIFLFLPIVYFFYQHLEKRKKHAQAILCLVISSLVFYAWWNPVYLVLILFSMAFNYHVGKLIKAREGPKKKRWLTFGVGINLLLLAYFKYFNFFIDNINAFTAMDLNFETIILPLAISFFTFQQIAFLVDSYKGLLDELKPVDYCLFVCFFPQLIAGPIVHHKEMLPQFSIENKDRLNAENIAIGLSIFAFGLFKKMIIADNVALYVSPVFHAAGQGHELSFFEAWGAALAYSFQLYFDFSAYSDMAIGVARIFGIVLPLNFMSPYKSTSIIEFWRRWHITLSRFLRDYVYIPLGGNRKGESRRYINLLLTMFLGGIWHGAGWTFVIWGSLHGLFLAINHLFTKLRKRLNINWDQSRLYKSICLLFTFFIITILWVYFRASSLSEANHMLTAMFDLSNIKIHHVPGRSADSLKALEGIGIGFTQLTYIYKNQYIYLILLFFIVIFSPNIQDIFSNHKPVLDSEKLLKKPIYILCFKLNWYWLLITILCLSISILSLNKVSEFLYFQF